MHYCIEISILSITNDTQKVTACRFVEADTAQKIKGALPVLCIAVLMKFVSNLTRLLAFNFTDRQ